jgi:hypothetical protein
MSKFKIGITAIGYECAEHIDKVFNPWMEVEAGAVSDLIESVHISVAHGCFNETYKIGYPISSTDGTIKRFQELENSGFIDKFNLFDEPDWEYEFWNSNLEFLFSKNINLLMMLNMDEVWTVEEIRGALEYINKTQEADYFKVNFKNLVINEHTYVKDFIVPRFWRTNRNGGIRGFHFDDELTFANGKTDKTAPFKVIPVESVFPRHYSWVGSEEFLQRKIAFQHAHYKTCSYAWDENKKQLILNEDYYRMTGKPKPQLFLE